MNSCTGARLALCLLVAWPLAGRAQSSGTHDHGMHHETMSSMPVPAASTRTSPRPAPVGHGAMRDHSREERAAQAMHMPMQAVPTNKARSPDYSDGVASGSMPGMDMGSGTVLGTLRLDRLEAFHGRHGNGQRWELQGWYGGDIDRLWLRSEGERGDDGIEGGDVELLWSHAASAFWNTQLGIRHDLGPGPARNWLAAGVEGLAPYFLDVAATLYLGPSGRTAARARVSYELLFTQRLILEPEFEANLHGKDDPRRGVGAGLSDASLGLRLRYEIRRRFAPYVGVAWSRQFGATADMAREQGRAVSDVQWVAGLHMWF